MINLRNDYGSSFDGYITIKNVTYKVGNNGYPNIIFSDNKQNQLEPVYDFVNQHGLLSDTEIMNLRRLGVLYDMGFLTYSFNEVRECLQLSDFMNSDNSLFWSSSLSLAGLELTSITLDYFLNLQESYDHWLRVDNKSLHLKDLTIDEDLLVKKNIVANGDVATGGTGEETS